MKSENTNWGNPRADLSMLQINVLAIPTEIFDDPTLKQFSTRVTFTLDHKYMLSIKSLKLFSLINLALHAFLYSTRMIGLPFFYVFLLL